MKQKEPKCGCLCSLTWKLAKSTAFPKLVFQKVGQGTTGKLHFIPLLEIPVHLPIPQKDDGPASTAGSPVLVPYLSPHIPPPLSLPTQGPRPRLRPAGGLGLPRQQHQGAYSPRLSSPDSEITPCLLIACCYLSLSVGLSLPAISTKILSHSS